MIPSSPLRWSGGVWTHRRTGTRCFAPARHPGRLPGRGARRRARCARLRLPYQWRTAFPPLRPGCWAR